jgi:prepilin-type N-terminal cleavage/methylation domain-containing protein
MYTWAREAAARRAGFTLVELMVAIVISGILTTVIFQVLHGNSRFVAHQSAREEVQQNSRASLDLIASDIRAAAAAGLLEIEPNAVRLYVPRGWGVLCGAVAPGNQNVWALFPAGTFPDDFRREVPHWGVAIDQTNDPTLSTGAYRFVNSVLPANSANPCASIQPNLTALHQAVGFRSPGPSLVDAGLTVPASAPLMVFEEVRYGVGQPAGSTDFWIQRMVGYGGGVPNMQPLAGPVPDGQALRFTYLRADGATTATTPAEVRQIRIQLITQSRGKRQVSGQMRPEAVDTATVEVFLRN